MSEDTINRSLIALIKAERENYPEEALVRRGFDKCIEIISQHNEPPIDVIRNFLRETCGGHSLSNGTGDALWHPKNPVNITKLALAMGGASTRKDEDCANSCQELPHANIASEICENDILKAVDCALKSKCLDTSLAVLDAMRPYLRTTEPVSVSLKACALAARKAFAETQGENPEDYEEDCCLAETKAALNAAGVTYVD